MALKMKLDGSSLGALHAAAEKVREALGLGVENITARPDGTPVLILNPTTAQRDRVVEYRHAVFRTPYFSGKKDGLPYLAHLSTDILSGQYEDGFPVEFEFLVFHVGAGTDRELWEARAQELHEELMKRGARGLELLPASVCWEPPLQMLREQGDPSHELSEEFIAKFPQEERERLRQWAPWWELFELADSPRTWQEARVAALAAKVDLQALSGEELRTAKLPAAEKLLTGLYRRQFAAITGAPNLGKDPLALDLAMSAAIGRTLQPAFACEPGRPVPVAILNNEDEPGEQRDRIERRIAHYRLSEAEAALLWKNVTIFGQGCEPVTLVEKRSSAIRATNYLKYIAETVAERGIELLVLSPLASFLALGTRTDDAEESAVRVLRPLLKAHARGCAFLFTRHVTKSGASVAAMESGRGGVPWSAAFRSEYHLGRVDKQRTGPAGATLVLHKVKDSYAAPWPEPAFFRMLEGGILEEVTRGATSPPAAPELNDLKSAIVQLAGEVEVSKNKLIKPVSEADKEIRAGLKQRFGSLATPKKIERAIEQAIAENLLWIERVMRNGKEVELLRPTAPATATAATAATAP